MKRYASLKQFLNDIDLVGEIEFAYTGKDYSLAYSDDGNVSIVECGKPETEQVFNSPEEFADRFIVNGKRFKEIVTEIDILLH